MTTQPKKAKAAREPSKSEALLAAVIAAGGTLDVRHVDVTPFSRLMSTANLYKVPPGKQLVWVGTHGRHAQQPQIRLEDLPSWKTIKPTPVAIPNDGDPQHPAVAALAKGSAGFDRFAVGRRPLALQHLGALAWEAQQRGYRITAGAAEEQHRRRTANQIPVHLTVTVASHHMMLGVDDGGTSGYLPERERLREQRQQGPISLHILNGTEHIGSRWHTGGNYAGVILAEILLEIELRAIEAEKHRLRRQAEEDERRLRWEQAMDTAKERYMEGFRADLLEQQAKRWRLAHDIGAYLDALQESLPRFDSDPLVIEWIAWGRAYRDRIDPLCEGLSVPKDHEPSKDDLARYLPKGMNPHGPGFSWR